jgi:hypothetical protein
MFADIQPHLAIELNLAGGLNINVSGYPGESYEVERSTDLLSWESFSGLTDSMSGPQKFYRLVLP